MTFSQERVSIAFLIIKAPSCGLACDKQAAIPAKTGDENEVPLLSPIVPSVVTTAVPQLTATALSFTNEPPEKPTELNGA